MIGEVYHRQGGIVMPRRKLPKIEFEIVRSVWGRFAGGTPQNLPIAKWCGSQGLANVILAIEEAAARGRLSIAEVEHALAVASNRERWRS